MRIIFMGTPDFAVPSLRAIVAAGHQVVAVYTQPPRQVSCCFRSAAYCCPLFTEEDRRERASEGDENEANRKHDKGNGAKRAQNHILKCLLVVPHTRKDWQQHVRAAEDNSGTQLQDSPLRSSVEPKFAGTKHSSNKGSASGKTAFPESRAQHHRSAVAR